MAIDASTMNTEHQASNVMTQAAAKQPRYSYPDELTSDNIMSTIGGSPAPPTKVPTKPSTFDPFPHLARTLYRNDMTQEQVEKVLGILCKHAAATTTVGGVFVYKLVMSRFEDSAVIQALGISILLAMTSDDKDDSNKHAIAAIGGIRLIVGAMRTHMLDASVASLAIQVLHQLGQVAELRPRIAATEGIVQCVVNGMSRHNLDNQELQIAGCKLLETLARDNTKTKRAIIDAGAVYIIEKAIKRHRKLGVSPKVEKECWPILSFLAQGLIFEE